ncbi:AbrB/MazE/SpoVT family DNA-binding domain-containing protein [Acidianus manzaensis]|uniref:AbrB family transcriptional regulator n=1 Tax=Acidianus manzaensis TaxID=282676 RepID=A0A1W6JZB5_9CREN|nr:AbrB/MazE/SpoVT family DNA-binding domain-containing protein [Acidianus manzaensis]ARM75623.1 AbrB family transcriptional regulator [Acidianus manzaensis]
MSVVKVSKNFQVTIPVEIRRKFQINEGEFVKIVYDENEKTVKIIKMNEKQ